MLAQRGKACPDGSLYAPAAVPCEAREACGRRHLPGTARRTPAAPRGLPACIQYRRAEGRCARAPQGKITDTFALYPFACPATEGSVEGLSQGLILPVPL